MKTILALCALATATLAQADILIGQTAGFTGTAAAAVQEITAGAKLYIDAVNERSGIGGQRIKLLAMDDKFDPKPKIPESSFGTMA